jgi:NhaC family Na+:H+ antiporter
LIALFLGRFLLAAIFAIIFQPRIINQIAGVEQMTFESGYKGVMDAITGKVIQHKTKHLLIYLHLADAKC